MMAYLGIEDPWVLAGYLLCILSTVLCVVYGLATWSRGSEEAKPEDVTWADKEKKAEEEL